MSELAMRLLLTIFTVLIVIAIALIIVNAIFDSINKKYNDSFDKLERSKSRDNRYK